jgi:PTS system lactose-specific IIC component
VVSQPSNEILNDQMVVKDFALPNNIAEYLKQKNLSKFHVLVVCQGAGSSAMLANAINVGARQYNLTPFIEASATTISQAAELTNNMDLVILSPQARAKQADIEALIKGTKTKLISLIGTQYVDSIRDKNKAIVTTLDGLGVIKLEKDKN